eukprot:1181735-Alexandrium_andersonii.AAC.1
MCIRDRGSTPVGPGGASSLLAALAPAALGPSLAHGLAGGSLGASGGLALRGPSQMERTRRRPLGHAPS